MIKLNKPAALIFDMDGTLVDNMRFHEIAWISLFRKAGVGLSDEEICTLMPGRLNKELIKNVIGENVSETIIDEYSIRKEQLYRQLFSSNISPMQGLEEFLDMARKSGVGLALATAAGKENVDFVLDGLGFRSIFDAIVCADDVTNGKPDPEIFLKASDLINTDPGDCIVFEDSFVGIEAAHRAGMAAIAVTTAHLPEEFQSRFPGIMTIPDYSLLSFTPN